MCAYHRDRTGQTLAGVDGIEGQGFQCAGQLDRLQRRSMHDAVGGTGMARDDFDGLLVEPRFE
jgi:hypothetical protein